MGKREEKEDLLEVSHYAVATLYVVRTQLPREAREYSLFLPGGSGSE